jgi:hypothetical protein
MGWRRYGIVPDGEILSRVNQVKPVLRTGYAKCVRQPARSAAEVPVSQDVSPRCTHSLQPGKWLKGANEYARGVAFGTAYAIAAPIDSVDAIDIHVPGWTEHDGISRGLPAKPMRGGVGRRNIGFNLYDSSRTTVGAGQNLVEQILGDDGRGTKEEGSFQEGSRPSTSHGSACAVDLFEKPRVHIEHKAANGNFFGYPWMGADLLHLLPRMLHGVLVGEEVHRCR